ncbi:MAG: hypothetical protein KGJ35_00705, partial [Patescibacteria group bacterium]|nr:hypothetical protein [Patescibacteria group bacterium]
AVESQNINTHKSEAISRERGGTASFERPQAARPASLGEISQQGNFVSRKGSLPERSMSTETSNKVYFGNPSYQITGLPPFTDNPFATIGNDWSLPHTVLTEKNLAEFHDIAEKVAEKMRESGWKGLFGIDVIYDEERDEMKLLEINARQPASTTFESQLQTKLRDQGIAGTTIFEAHLSALVQGQTLYDRGPTLYINDGAQVIQRITNVRPMQNTRSDLVQESMETAGYNVIPYNNTKPNSDLLRIQSDRGIMEKPGKFNQRGEAIIKILEK